MNCEVSIQEQQLWKLVAEGKVIWAGGKPTGSRKPVRMTPGPGVTEMVAEGRR